MIYVTHPSLLNSQLSARLVVARKIAAINNHIPTKPATPYNVVAANTPINHTNVIKNAAAKS